MNLKYKQFDLYAIAVGYVGGNVKLGSAVTWRPNVVGRYMQGLPYTIDCNMIFTHKVGLDFGASYQVNSAIGGIVGYDFGNKFYVGYSYTNAPTAQSQSLLTVLYNRRQQNKPTNPHQQQILASP